MKARKWCKIAVYLGILTGCLGAALLGQISMGEAAERMMIEQEIQEYLKAHYANALDFYRKGMLNQALIEFQKVNDIEPGYKKTEDYLKKIQDALKVLGTEQDAMAAQESPSQWVDGMDVTAREVNVRAKEVNVYSDRLNQDLDMEAMQAAGDFATHREKRLREETQKQREEEKKQREAEKKRKREEAIAKKEAARQAKLAKKEEDRLRREEELRQRKEAEEKREAVRAAERQKEKEMRAKEKQEQEFQQLMRQGQDLYMAGRYPQAVDKFAAALEKSPKDKDAKTYLQKTKIELQRSDRFESAHRMYLDEDYDAALKAFEGILKDEPDNVRAVDFIERTQKAQIQAAEQEDLRKIRELHRKGMGYSFGKEYDNAIYTWEQALKLDPDPSLTQKIRDLIAEAKLAKVDNDVRDFKIMETMGDVNRIADVARAAVPDVTTPPKWATERLNLKPRQTDLYVSEDKQKLLDTLNTRYSLEFNNASLVSVIETLTSLTGLNIIVDTKSIAELAQGDMASVLEVGHITMKVKDLPLLELLKAVLRFTDLSYMIEDNMVWITTKERIDSQGMQIAVFDVQDLVGRIVDFPSKGLEGINVSTGSSEAPTE